jgi:hypothetical protein
MKKQILSFNISSILFLVFSFLFMRSLIVYEISSEGELVKAHHNFWSLFLNRNKIKN